MENYEFPSDLEQQALIKFKTYDLDHSNFIEIKELKTLMTDVSKEIGIPEPNDDDIYTVLKENDRNDDNKISFEEFVDLYKVIYMMKVQSK